MTNLKLLSEFWEFLKLKKSYWLIPIVIAIMVGGALIVFTESSAIAPFIYTLF